MKAQTNGVVMIKQKINVLVLLLLSLGLAWDAGHGVRVVHAQDLRNELDALDEVPEDDLTAGAKAADAKTAAKAANDATDTAAKDADKTEDLDNLPPDDLEPSKAPEVAKDKEPVTNDAGPTDQSLKDEVENLDKDLPVADQPTPGDSLTGAASEPTGKMTSLDFQQLPDRVRLKISADRPVNWSRELRSKRRQVIVEIRNMRIARSILRRALDTGEFDGPVALLQAFESKAGPAPAVKVLFQLRQFVDPTILRSGNELYIDFPIVSADGTLFKNVAGGEPKIPKTILSAADFRDFKGEKINLNVKDADLSDVINLLSKVSGKNFVLGNVSSATKVTLNVRNTPWDQVFSIILLNASLGYQIINDTYRIVSIADLKKEIGDATQAAKDIDALTPMETRLLALSYAKAKDLESKVKPFLTVGRGSTVVDDRTNTLTVTDTAPVIEKIQRYLKAIDKQTPLVSIEARIVEAKQDISTNIGVQWKVGDIVGTKFSGSFVNVGAPVASGQANSSTTGTQGGMNVRFGQLGALGTIQAVLQLLEEENKAKLIASPRVTVSDNRKALLSQGQTVVIQGTAAPGGPPALPTSKTRICKLK